MATVAFSFFGALDIQSGGRQLLKPPTLKSQSLLAYLVLHRAQPQPRERLVGLFWGERTARKARRSLSTALWHIRRCLPDESLILGDTHLVQFEPESDLWLDVEEFEVMAGRDDVAGLQAATALYAGDFLDGFYDDWVIGERYRLEALFLEALAKLMALQAATGDRDAALAAALRLLSHDPLREDAHRVAMRAYCYRGQRNLALEQYERCRQMVQQELGAEPMIETNELYQRILAGALAVAPVEETFPLQAPAKAAAGRSPLDVIAPVRLVGRERELRELEGCWQRTCCGRGGLVLISGEVGVGKTRLVETFANILCWRGVRVLWGHCYELERALPYQPFTEALRATLPALRQDALAGLPVWVLAQVARVVPELREGTVARGALLAQERGMEGEREIELAGPALNQEQAILFDGVARLLAELSSRSGILVILEDLHWASESSLQLLHHVARALQGKPVMMVGTFRPEAIGLQHLLVGLRRQLGREGVAEILHLPRLPAHAVEAMLVEMSGAGEPVTPLAERLYRETEGNPLFLMEIVKALFETGAIRLEEGAWRGDFARISEGELPLPPGVSEAVLARVGRLNTRTQEALRRAAILGGEFNFDVLNEVWGQGEEETLRALDDLLRQRLIEESGSASESDFTFTHHKIQEVVYQALPSHRRRFLHAQTARALERVSAGELEARAAEVAHHFEQACELDESLCSRAVHYLRQAAQQAVHQSAHREAMAYCYRGLEILHSRSQTPICMRQEIELQMLLAAPLAALHGYASPEIRRVYNRARHLCEKIGETPELFASLVGLARYYGLTGDIETSEMLANRLRSIAEGDKDPALLLEAYRQLGGPMFSAGRLREAGEIWERGVDFYDLQLHERCAYRFGHDPAVTCLGYLSMTQWLLGSAEQARRTSERLCQLLQSMTHPFSRAYANCLLSVKACMCLDVRAARAHAEAALRLGQLHGLSSWQALARALHGWTMVWQGEAERGLLELQEGISAWQASNLIHLAPFLLALEAQACLKMGKMPVGLAAIGRAQAITQQEVDLYWEPELNRLRGELLSAAGSDSLTVEVELQRAMKAARRLGALMLELRATMSLARLWRDEGRFEQAQALLTAVYERFDEGFDTVDLREAASLLGLSGQDRQQAERPMLR